MGNHREWCNTAKDNKNRDIVTPSKPKERRVLRTLKESHFTANH
jgi:hypothetical protein